jgi:ABC-2 type transport system ATP-binding protein
MKIELSNLEKHFGTNTAVDIDSFTINNGDILGLVGNNGAGKTTLFRLMLDLLKADEGVVTMHPSADGVELVPSSLKLSPDGGVVGGSPINPALSEDWKAYTGAYIDDGFLIDFLTAEEYFDFIGRVSGMTKEQIAERLVYFEPLMGGEILNQKKYIRDFSAGNRHKVGIIAALLNRPELVILDEPFNFLDPRSQNMLKKILVEYNNETGATVILSSHNLQHTTEISTRIALLEHGVIIKDLDNHDAEAVVELQDYFKV